MAGRARISAPGDPVHAFAPGEAMAFCMGMRHRAGGTELTAPLTDNPFAIDPELGNWRAWAEGWLSADGDVGNPAGLNPHSCAIAPQVVAEEA